MAKRREFTVFSLSFLDIMSCGFGAVILIFIVIHHGTESRSQNLSSDLMAQVKALKDEVTAGKQRVVTLKADLQSTEDTISASDKQASDIASQIKTLEAEIVAMQKSGSSTTASIEKLKQELKKLEKQDASLKGSVQGEQGAGASLRTFVGEGNREYLTGMRMGGTHILILLDDSGSMLHRTIVNAVRMSFMSDAEKLKSAKWQRAVKTIEWIMANMPKDSKFQLYTFDTHASPVIPGTAGKWLTSLDRKETDKAVAMLQKVVPGGGTSLEQPFVGVGKFNPPPDNIFLLTDGLPTEGMTPPKKATVTPAQRAKLFSEAVQALPEGIPVNVILFPMEGDPQAAPLFWLLAQITHGSFMSPSTDWP